MKLLGIVAMLAFESTTPPAISQDVESFEELIATKLPCDYSEFLTAINGGCPAYSDDIECMVHWNGQKWANPVKPEGAHYFYKLDERQGGQVLT